MNLFRASALAAALLLQPVLASGAEGPLATAIQLFDAGRYAEAHRAFDTYAAAHPRDAEGAYWNGRSLLALHDNSKAIEWLEKATTLAPRRADVFLALGRAYGRAAQEASLLRKPGLARSAREAWEKAVAFDPTDLDARDALMQFYLFAPGLMGGGVDKARHQADEIARRDAVRGAVARATIAQHEKDDAGAEGILQDALARSPGNLELRRSLGQIYQNEQKWDAAFALYEQILQQDADAWVVLYQVGRAAAVSGQRLDRGAAALQRYLGHTPAPEEPSLANAHYRLGMIYEHQGNLASARAEYQAALRLDVTLRAARAALDELG